MWPGYLRKKYNGKEKDAKDSRDKEKDARDARLKKTDKELEDCGGLWLCTVCQICSDLESRATLLHLPRLSRKKGKRRRKKSGDLRRFLSCSPQASWSLLELLGASWSLLDLKST